MKQILIPLCLFGSVGLLLFGMITISEARANLTVDVEELKSVEDGSWSINPCKYTYWRHGDEEVTTTVTNYSGRTYKFDMDDGNTLEIPARTSVEYTYKANLVDDTIRFYIKKLTGTNRGISIQDCLVLKLVFEQKGGD